MKPIEYPSIDDAMRRVTRGLKLMLKTGYRNDLINILANNQDLNMASPSSCIFGNVLGSYSEGQEIFGLTDEECRAYGFEARTFNAFHQGDSIRLRTLRAQDYSLLQECWIFAISRL